MGNGAVSGYSSSVDPLLTLAAAKDRAGSAWSPVLEAKFNELADPATGTVGEADAAQFLTEYEEQVLAEEEAAIGEEEDEATRLHKQELHKL